MHHLTIGDVFCLSVKTPFSIQAEKNGNSITKQIEQGTIFDLFVTENDHQEKRLALHFPEDDLFISMEVDDFLPLSNIVETLHSSLSQTALSHVYEAKSISIHGDVTTHEVWKGEITVYDIIPSDTVQISTHDISIDIGNFSESKETLISVLTEEEEKCFLITFDQYEEECVSYVEELDEDRIDFFLSADKKEVLCTDGTFALVEGLNHSLSLIFDEGNTLQFLHVSSEGNDKIIIGDDIKEEEISQYNVKGLGLA